MSDVCRSWFFCVRSSAALGRSLLGPADHTSAFRGRIRPVEIPKTWRSNADLQIEMGCANEQCA